VFANNEESAPFTWKGPRGKKGKRAQNVLTRGGGRSEKKSGVHKGLKTQSAGPIGPKPLGGSLRRIVSARKEGEQQSEEKRNASCGNRPQPDKSIIRGGKGTRAVKGRERAAEKEHRG